MLVAVLFLSPTVIVCRHIYFIIQADVSEELDIVIIQQMPKMNISV